MSDMKLGRWFWGIVAAQVLILAVMIAGRVYTQETGTAVLLKTRPVDPWDLFRGDYVVLSYEISQLTYEGKPWERPERGWGQHPESWEPPYRKGDVVWVTLQKGEKYWTSVAIGRERPNVAPNQVALKGRVTYAFPEAVNVKYGIEQFYVPEGKGRELEREPTAMDIEAAVDQFGNAAILRVFFKGQEVKWK